MTEEEIYRPYGDRCTVHNCDEPATRYLKWEDSRLVAGFCNSHAEGKLAVEGVVERPGGELEGE